MAAKCFSCLLRASLLCSCSGLKSEYNLLFWTALIKVEAFLSSVPSSIEHLQKCAFLNRPSHYRSSTDIWWGEEKHSLSGSSSPVKDNYVWYVLNDLLCSRRPKMQKTAASSEDVWRQRSVVVHTEWLSGTGIIMSPPCHQQTFFTLVKAAWVSRISSQLLEKRNLVWQQHSCGLWEELFFN